MNRNVLKVESLIAKAERSQNSSDALKYSQAACNAANAMAVLHDKFQSLIDYDPRTAKANSKLG